MTALLRARQKRRRARRKARIEGARYLFRAIFGRNATREEIGQAMRNRVAAQHLRWIISV